ncbi:hypothetical protein K438DRAFT_1123311 [Mycena galopus ATCC 62051]|nr:hypothetical protein K438DRAFT_1123311 [Mycena galopus ATCC 62051]
MYFRQLPITFVFALHSQQICPYLLLFGTLGASHPFLSIWMSGWMFRSFVRALFPVRSIAAVTTAVANGDLSKQIKAQMPMFPKCRVFGVVTQSLRRSCKHEWLRTLLWHLVIALAPPL